jgi:hypothetical protein
MVYIDEKCINDEGSEICDGVDKQREIEIK